MAFVVDLGVLCNSMHITTSAACSGHRRKRVMVKVIGESRRMGLVQSKWENEECRSEDGIYFPDDTLILLAGSPSKGYQASVRQPLQALLEANPNGWTDIDPNPSCSAEDRSLLILVGGGAYEGEGFLAVVDSATRRLVWLLHLDGVERFTEVRVDGSLLQAVSAEYPFRHEWTIPLESPHSLLVTTLEC